MTTLANSILRLNEMVAKTSHGKVDVFLQDIAIWLKEDKEEHDNRSAFPDDKTKVAAFYDSLNGEIMTLRDVSPKEIVARAGARDNQGVRMHARRELDRRLLTYAKPEETATATTKKK